MATKPTSFLETFAMKSTTLYPPEPMGIDSTKAYGGCTLGVAVKAAANAVPPNYHLYSLVGQYLGLAVTDRVLSTSIREIRQTRTFATRLVEVTQKSDSGQDRACLIAWADFQVPKPASLLEYSATPTRPYTDHSKLEGENEQRQNMNGLMKQAPTFQNHFPVPQKSSADWVSSLDKLPDHAENMAALAFLLDGATGFVALAFSTMFLDDAGAASSLDFVLRVFDNRVDMAKWNLRELVTHVVAEGKDICGAKALRGGGRCVGSMTQQTILRPNRIGKEKL